MIKSNFSPDKTRITDMVSCKLIILILVASILILTSCTSSLPVMDANLMDYNLTISSRVTLAKDIFTDTNKMVNSEAIRLNRTLVYNFPLNLSVGQKLGSRIEIGGYILGLYGKLLFVKPERYDKFSISNMVISGYAAVNVAGILTSGHFIEELAEGGLLIGIPLRRDLSLTTGLIDRYSVNVWENILIEDVLFENSGLSAIRHSLIIPINLLYNFRYLPLFCYVNLNIPFDIREEYCLYMRYKNKDEMEYKPLFINKNNYSLRMGLGLLFNRKDRCW